MLHTVFSISQQPYQAWQAELLSYSHARAGQEGPVTCLVSTNDPPQPMQIPTFVIASRSPHPVTGDDYAPYNKPYALSYWAKVAETDKDGVLILDPDCVFLRPIRIAPLSNRPLATPVTYMHARSVQDALRRHWANLAELQPIAIPIVIHRDDLAQLAPLWSTRTEELRADPVARSALGWICEMWGCSIAAAQLGLRFQLQPLCTYPTDDDVERPIIHYCYESTSRDGRWRWDKRGYRPWERVPMPPASAPRAAIALAELINNFVEERTTSTSPTSIGTT